MYVLIFVLEQRSVLRETPPPQRITTTKGSHLEEKPKAPKCGGAGCCAWSHHWITSKQHWTESAYCHSFGSREMSELWLPRWHCPFLILAEGRPEAQSGFLDLGLWLAYGYK